MTGLVGVYDARAGANALQCIVDRMCRAATSELALSILGAGSDAARCGVFEHEGQRSVARAGDVWLVSDGELYNHTELAQRVFPHGQLATGDNHGALCLELWSREGNSFVHRLNGQFNIAIYDAA